MLMPSIYQNIVQDKPLYIGFLIPVPIKKTIGGYGGLQHCLIPAPQHILIAKNENETLEITQNKEQQTNKDFLNILGYELT